MGMLRWRRHDDGDDWVTERTTELHPLFHNQQLQVFDDDMVRVCKRARESGRGISTACA